MQKKKSSNMFSKYHQLYLLYVVIDNEGRVATTTILRAWSRKKGTTTIGLWSTISYPRPTSCRSKSCAAIPGPTSSFKSFKNVFKNFLCRFSRTEFYEIWKLDKVQPMNYGQPYQPQQALPNNSETFSKSVFPQHLVKNTHTVGHGYVKLCWNSSYRSSLTRKVWRNLEWIHQLP